MNEGVRIVKEYFEKKHKVTREIPLSVVRNFDRRDDGDLEVPLQFACEACGETCSRNAIQVFMVKNTGFQIGWEVRKQPKAQSRTREDVGMGWKSVSVRL
jgi:formate hydrogenlyase subunit 6/NADH:ubiquinone oxidoreductase subunit I